MSIVVTGPSCTLTLCAASTVHALPFAVLQQPAIGRWELHPRPTVIELEDCVSFASKRIKVAHVLTQRCQLIDRYARHRSDLGPPCCYQCRHIRPLTTLRKECCDRSGVVCLQCAKVGLALLLELTLQRNLIGARESWWRPAGRNRDGRCSRRAGGLQRGRGLRRSRCARRWCVLSGACPSSFRRRRRYGRRRTQCGGRAS